MDSIIRLFKDTLEDKLNAAKASLIYNNGVQPLFITSKDGKVCQELSFSVDDNRKEMESFEMKAICKDPEIKVAAILMDSYTATTDTEEEANQFKGQVEDHPNVMEALILALHTRKTTFIRTVPYRKIKEQDYWFGDMGWQEVSEPDGYFSNTFK